MDSNNGFVSMAALMLIVTLEISSVYRIYNQNAYSKDGTTVEPFRTEGLGPIKGLEGDCLAQS